MRARWRPLRRVAVMAALAAGALAAGQQTPPPPVQTPTQQQPVFRTGVETVAIYATVLDQYDELVKNLTPADFEILDDGKPQEVTIFEAGLQPITAILMIDTSESMALNVELARYAAEQFVIRMLPGDKVRVGSFSDAITISPEFTSDRDLLLNDIRERLHIGNPTRLWDAVDQTMTDLAPLGGRRILVLFTDGDDTYSKRAAVTVLDRARSDELMVYTVQFRTTQFARRQEIASMKMPSLKEAFIYDPGRNPPPAEALRRISTPDGRRQLRAGPERQRRRDVHADRRGAALSVRDRLLAAEARRQDPRPRGQAAEEESDGARAQELLRGAQGAERRKDGDGPRVVRSPQCSCWPSRLRPSRRSRRHRPVRNRHRRSRRSAAACAPCPSTRPSPTARAGS